MLPVKFSRDKVASGRPHGRAGRGAVWGCEVLFESLGAWRAKTAAAERPGTHHAASASSWESRSAGHDGGAHGSNRVRKALRGSHTKAASVGEAGETPGAGVAAERALCEERKALPTGIQVKHREAETRWSRLRGGDDRALRTTA